MDEEYNDSVDTSTDMDVSDVDVSDDIPADIPDDIPEDDYSDADVADDFSEDVPEESFEDDVEYDDIDEPVEDDSIESETEEFDESMDDIEEDTLEESEEVSDVYGESDDISEDTDGFDEELENEADETEDIPEDVDYTEMADQDEAFKEDIPENVIDTEATDETSDVEDTDTSDQPDDVSDTEATDETTDVEDTDTSDQPDDVSDTESTDEITDVEDTDASEQPEDVTDTEATDETTDVEDSNTSEQTEDVTDAEVADETSDVEDTNTSEQMEDVTDAEGSDVTTDVEDADAAEQPEDVTNTETTDETSDVANADAAEQPEDVSDAEIVDESSDVENTGTSEQPKDVTDVEYDDAAEQSEKASDTNDANHSDLETYDYETSPETQDAVNPETSGEYVSADNPYRERWEEFADEFSDGKDESDGWDSLKYVPFAGDAQSDAIKGSDTSIPTESNDTSEINSISDYMNAHNYGPDDFATCSQDPQWRQLMRQEYPDYELPEMTQERANAQLSQYMNDHNYGVGDYAEYSQDPIWRELHSTAFPDDELPPLNEVRNEQEESAVTSPKGGDSQSFSDLNKGGNNPPSDSNHPWVCPVCGENPCVCNNDSSDINPPHPTCPVCGHYPCVCDTRDDQGNYPTLKSMENKEYFDSAKSSYFKAEDVAGESGLKFYKAHDMDHHIDKVIERSAEASDVINEITNSNCDKKDLAAAALYHDTGMDGGDKYVASDGDGIRKNHPMSSAIHVLNNREALENDGCNADQVAALSLLHSKSCSGVRNLADTDQIEGAFDKLQSEVDEYNAVHPDNHITFDRNAIDVEKFKYNAASLRLGDAYGHDSSSTKTQSGGYYDIDFGEGDELSHDEWGEEYWKDEIKDSNLTFHENDETYSINDSNDPSGYTRMYQFGEGNIASMHSKIGGEGEFESVIDINNGMAKPLCTQECLLERLKELKTADELFSHSTTINLYGDCDEKHMALYESFARENEAEYGRIQINRIGGKYNGNN